MEKVLGASLDKLITKLENPDTVGLALDGAKQFNKDPNFYSTYARNFVKKSVRNNSDADPRVGYIKQVSFFIYKYMFFDCVLCFVPLINQYIFYHSLTFPVHVLISLC